MIQGEVKGNAGLCCYNNFQISQLKKNNFAGISKDLKC